jgi:A/G-specific adenine glycosylase
MARLFAVDAPLPDAEAGAEGLAAGLVATTRPGDWAQALMDLGASHRVQPKAAAVRALPDRGALRGVLATGARSLSAPDRHSVERLHRHGVAWCLTQGGQESLVAARRRDCSAAYSWRHRPDWRTALDRTLRPLPRPRPRRPGGRRARWSCELTHFR